MSITPEKERGASGPVHPASAAASRLFGSEKTTSSGLLSSMISQQMSFLSMATAFNVVMARQVSNLVLSAWGHSLNGAANIQKASHAGRKDEPLVKSAPSGSKLRVVVDNVPAETEQKKVANEAPKSVSKAARPAEKSKRDSASVDDLKRISGIGPKLETILQGKGITRFSDIARLSAAKANKLDQELGLGGRISRDQWVEKAKALLKEQA